MVLMQAFKWIALRRLKTRWYYIHRIKLLAIHTIPLTQAVLNPSKLGTESRFWTEVLRACLRRAYKNDVKRRVLVPVTVTCTGKLFGLA